MRLPATITVLSAVLSLVACGGGEDGAGEIVPLDSAGTVAEGAKHYLMCSRCHGQRGEGVIGEYPPLAGSRWVNERPDLVLAVVMHGLRGPIVRNGVTWDQVMAPGARFSDQQFAELISYIRTFEGNSGALVSVEEMAAARAAFAGRRGTWTEGELEAYLSSSPSPATP